jgi:hypothetical protein
MMYSELYPRITPVTGLAPNAMIFRAIQDASVEYFRTSHAWRYDPAPLNTQAGVGSYTFVVPATTRASKIIVAKYGDKPLEPTSSLQRRMTSTQDPVSTYQLIGGDSVIINGLPQDANSILTLEVALEPTFDATSIPDDEFALHYEGLMAGAIARLLLMPAQPWSAPGNAEYYQSLFYGKIAEAKSRGYADNTAKIRVTSYGGI